MDDGKWERWGALGGIIFVVLMVITIVLPGEPPGISDPAGDVVKFIVDKGDELRWSAYISGVATIFLFWWLGSLWRLMRRLEGGSPRLSVSALAGGVFASLLAVLAGITLGALPIIGVPQLGANGTRAFYVVATCLGFGALFGIAALVGSTSILFIRMRSNALLGWFGVVVAVISIIGGYAVASSRDAVMMLGFVGFCGALLWVLILSVQMLRNAPEPA
jgi:hypothetical protein